MIRRPPRSTQSRSSAASDVYKRQVGQFAVFHVATDEIAKGAAEIFVARIRHERARVRDHADEALEQAETGERVRLPLHAFLLVEYPPRRGELDFSGHRA